MIDDEPAILKNRRKLLEMENYRVLTAGDGRTGVKLAKETNPDLILIDVRMPDFDGGDVAHALDSDKENPALAKIPRFFLTSLVDKNEKVDLPDAKYISKQSSLPEFLKTIAEALTQRPKTKS